MVADRPENLIIKLSVACSAMFSEGQGATAALFFKKQNNGERFGQEENPLQIELATAALPILVAA